MNRLFIWIISAMFAVCLTACGEQSKPAPAKTEATPVEKVEKKVNEEQMQGVENNNQAQPEEKKAQ